MNKERNEFFEKSAEIYLKGRYNPGSLQKIMNEKAIELTRGDSYIQEFSAGVKKVRENLQKPRVKEKQSATSEDAKRLRRNRTEYAGEFKEDVEKIRKRMYGK